MAALSVLNSTFNNILFFFVNVCVDIGLVRFSTRNLARKRELCMGNENDPHLSAAIKLKERINNMVVTNGVIYIISHFPEFVTTILMFVYEAKLRYYCGFVFSCISLFEMVEAFNFFSICLEFFIFKRFDHNFQSSWHNLLTRLRSKTNFKRRLH